MVLKLCFSHVYNLLADIKYQLITGDLTTIYINLTHIISKCIGAVLLFISANIVFVLLTKLTFSSSEIISTSMKYYLCLYGKRTAVPL